LSRARIRPSDAEEETLDWGIVASGLLALVMFAVGWERSGSRLVSPWSGGCE